MSSIYPIDLDELDEDEVRAEIERATPDALEQMVSDGIYSFGATPQADARSIERMAALFVALREAAAAGRLPTTVALTWDLVLATVIDNTLAHRARPVFPMPGRSPGQLQGDRA